MGAEDLVEHLLPCPHVDGSGRGEDAVKIEEEGLARREIHVANATNDALLFEIMASRGLLDTMTSRVGTKRESDVPGTGDSSEQGSRQ